jgi:N-acetylneuraminic acid mutarotase
VWLHAGDLIQPRNATNVVVVGTGEVLVVGSDYQTSWLSACGASTDGSDSVEIGDPVAGVWEKTSSLPSLRDAPAVVALPDGRALLTGGAAGESIGWSAFSSTYLFDPTTRLWSRSGLLNTARTGTAAAVLADGRVLVAGGTFMDRTSPDPPRPLDTSELWDPRAGTWTRTGGLDETRVGASAVTLADGRVLIVGGATSLESVPFQQASAEVYDPTSGRWSSAGTLATARNGFVLVALLDGGAIIAGGFGDLGPTGYARLSTVERFDPVSKTWSVAGDLPYPVGGASGIRLADGRVLLAGGSVREIELIDVEAGTYVSGLTADAVLFDPLTGTWTTTAPMPSARAGASAVLLADGSVVVTGGSASEGEPYSTPGCPDAHPQVVRYIPGP